MGCEEKSFEVDVKIYLTSLEMRDEQTEEKTAKGEEVWCLYVELRSVVLTEGRGVALTRARGVILIEAKGVIL